MLNQTPATPMGMTSTAPQPVKPLAPGAFNAQAPAINDSVQQGLQPLMQALMKQKMQAKLAGKLPGTTPQLPGTTPQSLGVGTGAGDAGPPPLALGGSPGPMLS